MSDFMRISGLASGIDTEQIVSDLMKAERMKVDSLEQKKTLLEWKQEDYRAINTNLSTLRDSTSNLRFQHTFLAKTVSSSDESAVTATASTNSDEITLDIEVTSLASVASKASTASISANSADKIDTSLSLWSQKDKFADTTFFSTQAEGDSFSFTINDETFTFNNTASLDQIISTVNSNENADVTMYYDEFADKLSLTTKVTGNNNQTGDEIQLTGAFVENLLFFSGAAESGGTNAVLKINGLDTERTSNNFSIDGINISLKDKTSMGVPVHLEVERDTDAIFESIKSWVEKYNETIDALNAELNEERYQDYDPLTDKQMEELTEHQIELWEEKAKSGLLKYDSVLRGELSNLRSAVYSSVEGLDSEYNHLSEIGITTGLASFSSDGSLVINEEYLDGKLVIDESQLRAAIEEEPDKVMALFTNSSGNSEEAGIAVRAYTSLNDAIDRITDEAGSSSALYDSSFIGKKIRSLNERILREEDRLEQVEDRYWSQFTAMEEFISQMNQQSTWISAQFGTGE